MSQPIRGQGGHFVILIGPKNTNLVEGVEILLPIKFRWIPFSGFRGEVENVSANQRPGRPFCFLIGPKNTKALSHVANIWPTKIMKNKTWWILFYFAYFEQGTIISSCVVHLFQNWISKAAWYGVKPATVRYFPIILVRKGSLHEKFTFIGCLADKFYCVKWWSIERTLRIDKNIYPREIQ